ncbi:MAG: hypothetical protein ACYSUX_13495 [Planctomycetota bacterium]|jgi:hypothetical protein
MEHNFKPVTRQLIIGALILVFVTIASFGIRRVRLGAYRSENARSTPSARPSEPEDQSLIAEAEPDYYPDDLYIIDDEHDLQLADESDFDEQTPPDDYSEEHPDPVNYEKAPSKSKSIKDGYAKSKAKKGSQKISLSDSENIFITEKGEAWYVSEGPGGDIVKTQVQVDGITGDITTFGGGYYGKSVDSQEPRTIPMGDYENIYITDEGEAWYVSEQPDGSGGKIQLDPE